ncbi:hypothetical protein V5N11_020371 [Cardamine amara subsp. amara]|uniref:Uncharacterized protein n=1 Tax=Cardamine amara subsp. amara TaxID=228776 RepID=A0ABD1B503_CARAN
MADRGALLLPQASIFMSFPNLHVWRFQNPRFSISDSHHLYISSSCSQVASVEVIPLSLRRFSYKIGAVTEKNGGYGRMERGKRGRKQRPLWEELFEDNVEDDDDDGGGRGRGRGRGRGDSSDNLDLWKILMEIVDNVWILKAFKSYGYLLPFIILSLFFSTGPKALLVSLAIAIGPSLLFYAFQKLIGWDKRRKPSIANQFGIDEEEEELVRRAGRIRYNPSSVRNNVNGRGVNRGSAEMASKFGGWDDLDELGTISEQPKNKPKRKPLRKRKRVTAAEPLLLRLLVSLFPFLSSYTNMLK